MYSLDREILRVHTHVKRLATRLGLISPEASERVAHDELADSGPGPLRFGCHVDGVCHGRRVCTKIKPRCHACVIQLYCLYPWTVGGG
jgi:endonuclease-3